MWPLRAGRVLKRRWHTEHWTGPSPLSLKHTSPCWNDINSPAKRQAATCTHVHGNTLYLHACSEWASDQVSKRVCVCVCETVWVCVSKCVHAHVLLSEQTWINLPRYLRLAKFNRISVCVCSCSYVHAYEWQSERVSEQVSEQAHMWTYVYKCVHKPVCVSVSTDMGKPIQISATSKAQQFITHSKCCRQLKNWPFFVFLFVCIPHRPWEPVLWVLQGAGGHGHPRAGVGADLWNHAGGQLTAQRYWWLVTWPRCAHKVVHLSQSIIMFINSTCHSPSCSLTPSQYTCHSPSSRSSTQSVCHSVLVHLSQSIITFINSIRLSFYSACLRFNWKVLNKTYRFPLPQSSAIWSCVSLPRRGWQIQQICGWAHECIHKPSTHICKKRMSSLVLRPKP